jgi:hypothetical protein
MKYDGIMAQPLWLKLKKIIETNANLDDNSVA